MAIPEAERRTIVSYQGNTLRVREAVERFLRDTWLNMESYRDADIDRMAARVVPVVLGAARQTGAMTSAFLAASATAALGEPVRPRAAGAVAEVRGVPASEVYRRPGATVWTALKDGKPLSAAVDEGLQRLLSLADTDLQLAQTHASRNFLSGDRRSTGFQRVLTGSENCGLCTLASTQRYHKERLMPVHPGCDCSVRPLYGDADPGQIISPARLEALHEAAAEQLGASDRSGRSPDYRDIVVRDHGEYGPTLAWRDQHFTGPADI